MTDRVTGTGQRRQRSVAAVVAVSAITATLGLALPEAHRQASKSTFEPEAVVTRMYELLSGPAGDRDWPAFASLFHANAVMGVSAPGAQGQRSYSHFTPTEYASRNREFFRTRRFEITEIHRTVERFADIAHVFSTYRYRVHDGAKVAQDGKGINSFQLVREGDYWSIVSVQWMNELPDVQIPSKYLGPPR